MPAGTLKLAPFQGGVHVWAALDSIQHMYAVGLDKAQATHCPSQPVMQTVPATSASTSTNRAGVAVRAAAPAPATGAAHTIRTGKLQVGSSEAVYVAME